MAVGYSALGSNLIASDVAVGYAAAEANKANANTAIGYAALHTNETGDSNVAIGFEALDQQGFQYCDWLCSG